MTQENQLVMFGSSEIAAPEIPKSREKALAKIEKNKGVGARNVRALTFEANKDFTDACKERVERFGSGSPNFHMTVSGQIAAAVGAKIDNADIGQLGLILYLRHQLPKTMRVAKDKDQEKSSRKALCDSVKELRKAHKELEKVAA